MHKSYEELCALAATGQITGDAMKVLDQHVKGCSSCRAFLEDLVPLKAHVTPVVAGSRIFPYTLPEGMRERFLQRAANDGLALSPGEPMERPAPSGISVPQTRAGFFERFHPNHIRPWTWFAPRFVVPALACVLCGALGFVAAEDRVRSSLGQLVVAPPQPSSVKADKNSAEIAALQRQNDAARGRLATASTELAHAQAQKQELRQELSEIAQRAAAGEQFEKRFREVSAQLQDADALATQMQAELESERGKAANADAVSLVQQKATEEANSKIANLEAQLDHFRELDSGKSLAGDLISARNLHIVDVYDTESNGERKRAFGRVFFVEGKSLVFYAYDLPDSRRANNRVEFQVWGEQAGVNTVSINLGAMRSDNSNQGRWVLSCDDPKVLNRINAVYITADQNPRRDSQPRGTKLMYAFLGSPNHP